MATRMKPSLRFKPADALVALAVLLLAAVCAVSLRLTAAHGGVPVIVVSIDGREADRIPLTEAGDGETRTYSGSGYTLTVRMDPYGAAVETADCPTQDCVHTGKITRTGQSIVCLPARISIVLEGASDGGVDAVVG